ncbi:MurR/RpiR family transcriptional regulator [Xylocopilactobacillus apicola]|uniref:HTH-type transcriptional regulator GlvR n=1 Tax=Xylocopilactobacillus apicola TaxID=2932184 RepID=A0AAU9D4R0_9LACO|nr:MurR/RpiR family transcriptional regulator [Xylocopilactobacillus apicola]BDR58483.1 HTH-type transcriptional regulator GlvR [Xylocopilactobacillus apicola]
MTIESAFNEHYHDLNVNERQTLSRILTNKRDFSNLTINELAKKALISKSFIIRLCKNIGYSGYSEFKYQLKRELEQADKLLNSQNILEQTKLDLSETMNLIDFDQLAMLCRKMKQAPRIYTYATGYGAKNILEDFKRGMVAAKKAIISFPTSIELKLNNSVMQKDDILFVVSMNGQADTVIKELPFLKEKGIIVVSITRFLVNPLASMSSFNLYLQTTDTNGFYTSYVPLCLLLDLIVKQFLNCEA